VKDCGGVYLTTGPRPGLPGPHVAGRTRSPDDTIGRSPLAPLDAPVDPGALHSNHRIDSAKPRQRRRIPRLAVDVVVDAEEDGCALAPSGGGVQLPSGASVGDATGVPAREVRRRCPAGLAVLVIADN